MKTNFKLFTSVTLLLSSLSMATALELIEPTGLDQVHMIIESDKRINRKVSSSDIANAQEAVSQMNNFIKEAIIKNALANDGDISIADTKEINAYLVEHYAGKWEVLRGEEGYANVEKKSSTSIMGKNALGHVWGQIYNLGFESTQKGKRLSSRTGRRSASFTSVGYDLGQVMQADIATGSLNNPTYKALEGNTGTHLDGIVQAIMSDQGLLQRISTGDLRLGAASADAMNALIIEGIKAEGLANDGRLTAADMRTLNHYLVSNHAEVWANLHGDDENDEETGFHKVQNDGAYARMFSDNVVNTVADGIYHLGFPSNSTRRLLNEDGNKNQRYEKVAWWLEHILGEDLAKGTLNNPNYKEIEGETGTTMDQMIEHIYKDEGLLRKVSMEDIRVAAASANEMNKLIIEAIKETGIAEDYMISPEDVQALNGYLVANHAEVWATLHGDDEADEETGYHRIQNDGAIGIMNGRNHINTLADAVYHLGFKTPYKHNLVNEDGNKNASFKSLAYWLNKALASDMQKGLLQK